MEKIKDDLYVKKGRFGWFIVYPIKKDQDKPYTKDNINWRNLLVGSTGSFIQMIILFVLMTFLIFAYMHDTEECYEMLENPCERFEEFCVQENPFSLGNFSIEIGDTNGEGFDMAEVN